jgi:hypothetical protein
VRTSYPGPVRGHAAFNAGLAEKIYPAANC